MSCAGVGNERLGRDAASVDTGTAEPLALDNRHSHSCARQPDGERRPGLPCADNNRLIFVAISYRSVRSVAFSLYGSRSRFTKVKMTFCEMYSLDRRERYDEIARIFYVDY